MKTISVVIPCFNEEDNVIPITNAIIDVITQQLAEYDYELILIDNKSTDNTRARIRTICEKDNKVKAIFNIKNFGQNNSPYYALCQATGDCALLICADFQDPIELIPEMVREWEKGHRVISMIKTTSKEIKFIYWVRTVYYKLIKKMSEVPQIEHFTGFGLYDRSFLDILRQLNDPSPFLRGVVAEYAPDHLEIPYEQQKRRAGKTKNNFFSLFDIAMLGFTSYTKSLRIATFSGFIIAGISFLIGLFYLIAKLCFWYSFAAGYAPTMIALFFMGGVQLCVLGMLGEYVMNMNTRIINRPLVIEEERINF